MNIQAKVRFRGNNHLFLFLIFYFVFINKHTPKKIQILLGHIITNYIN